LERRGWLLFEVEIFTLLIIALFFTLLYLLRRDTNTPLTWCGIVGSMTWIILGLVFFVGRALQGMSTYIVGLFFNGIGIIFIIMWMIDLLNMGKWAKHLGEVET